MLNSSAIAIAIAIARFKGANRGGSGGKLTSDHGLIFFLREPTKSDDREKF